MFANINEIHFRSDAQRRPAAAHWRSLIERQPGFKGFLALDKGEDQAVIITLWESREAAEGWANNPDFQELQKSEMRPNFADWSITHAQVEEADLRNIVV